MKISVYKWNNKSLLWLLGFTLIILATIFVCVNRLTVSVLSQSSSLPIYSVSEQKSEDKVALTINCAWGNDDIADILALLKEENVKATFFIVGDFCDKYPEDIKEIYIQGHEIGNHSNTHSDLTTLSGDDFTNEVNECTKKLEAITKSSVKLFRCPSGAYNSNVIDQIENLGYYPIQWDCDSLDWKGLSVSEQESCIMKKLKSGSILLFHNDTDYSVDSLKNIITKVKDKGYSFETVGKLIYTDNYKIDVNGVQQKLD